VCISRRRCHRNTVRFSVRQADQTLQSIGHLSRAGVDQRVSSSTNHQQSNESAAVRCFDCFSQMELRETTRIECRRMPEKT
jgi:hypothetical protein